MRYDKPWPNIYNTVYVRPRLIPPNFLSIVLSKSSDYNENDRVSYVPNFNRKYICIDMIDSTRGEGGWRKEGDDGEEEEEEKYIQTSFSHISTYVQFRRNIGKCYIDYLS